MQQQVNQAIKIQNVLRDEKTLQPDADIERRQQSFHSILRTMLMEYFTWKKIDYDMVIDMELNVSDRRIQDLLAATQLWHPKIGAPAFGIDGINAERGFWSLWEISLGSNKQDKKILSIFINEAGIYRPAASKMIWDELLRGQKNLTMYPDELLDDATIAALTESATAVAEDAFIEMQGEYHKRNDREYQKRKYALGLRIEAAGKIGIENIRLSRIQKLQSELEALIENYEQQKTICPAFGPVLICAVR